MTLGAGAALPTKACTDRAHANPIDKRGLVGKVEHSCDDGKESSAAIGDGVGEDVNAAEDDKGHLVVQEVGDAIHDQHCNRQALCGIASACCRVGSCRDVGCCRVRPGSGRAEQHNTAQLDGCSQHRANAGDAEEQAPAIHRNLLLLCVLLWEGVCATVLQVLGPH